ncbi:type IV pilus secretin PilQ [Calditerrivibrio nitroreducens]|uniref:Type II and III secretion system protein n=1 Tax=Calditerrivibrio nitroreducens (strain DSM 19672 / NBRC 101217 / Yu37-1) TaxID=768670 RepID=E4TEL1_CALNY|nr:type IV pilus secretin PilQ [Calditerrivibrio nitroreducens]ADR19368.1 type II and III secretion system protein [Calditerrivibrio nitroreducens DSM 19672]
MKKIFLYILIAVLMIFGCAEKKSVLLDDNKNAVGRSLIKGLDIKKDDKKYEMIIKVNDPKDISVYYGKNPYSLTIMLPEADVDADAMKFTFKDDLVERFSILPKQDKVIITITLKDDVDYSYSTNNDGVIVKFKVDKADVKSVLKSSNWLENVEILNVKPATFISELENLSNNSEVYLTLVSDGTVKIDYGFINADNIYVDFYDVKMLGDKTVYQGMGIVKEIKVVTSLFPQKVRLILAVDKPVDVNVGFKEGKFIITSNNEKLTGSVVFINKIDSRVVGKVQGISLSSGGKLKYEKKVIDGNLVLVFDERVRFAREVSPINFFDGTPIKYVKVGKVMGKPAVVFVPNGDVYSKVEDDKGAVIVYSSSEQFTKTVDTKKDVGAKGKVEASELISLSIKDMDVKEAIKLIYYGRNKNIIFGKEVQGKTSIFVKDVHYKTALAAIYRENSLVEVEEDNVVWVISKSRQDEILAEKNKLMKLAEEEKKTEPLFTEIIPVNYYKASDFDAVVKGVLSPRGKVQVESKSNSFVVTDTKDSIAKVKNVLKEVDKPTPQVTIEARVVEVSDSNDLAYGIKWGANTKINRTSINFPNSIGINGDAGGYMVNLPIGAPTGALALTLGNISNTFNIDMAISAMESRNKAKTISSPKITTLDNQEAEIKSGGKAIIVPSGDNTQSQTIDVGIKLKVKPHITANNMIFMEIEVEKSSLGAVSGTNAETLEKKAKTQVLLANGETTVIGGIYEDEQNEIKNEVPGLSKIPLLGWLFRNNIERRAKKELLVFITPRIQNK